MGLLIGLTLLNLDACWWLQCGLMASCDLSFDDLICFFNDWRLRFLSLVVLTPVTSVLGFLGVCLDVPDLDL